MYFKEELRGVFTGLGTGLKQWVEATAGTLRKSSKVPILWCDRMRVKALPILASGKRLYYMGNHSDTSQCTNPDYPRSCRFCPWLSFSVDLSWFLGFYFLNLVTAPIEEDRYRNGLLCTLLLCWYRSNPQKCRDGRGRPRPLKLPTGAFEDFLSLSEDFLARIGKR